MFVHELPSYLIAGVLSGWMGLLVFLMVHHFWIKPIWFIAPLGLLISTLGGLAVGWAYNELYPGLPPMLWKPLAVFAGIGTILTPAILLAEMRHPIFDMSVPGGKLAISLGRAIAVFILELLVTSTLMGSTLGWWIGRTRQAAFSAGLAGFIFALGPGHNIPFLGGTPGNVKGILLLSAIVLVSSVVLVGVDSVFRQ